MRLSNYFLPTKKEDPIDATIISHKLMIRAGMIRQVSSGLYTWLPLGLKVLKKVENIIRKEMDRSGALEVLMPTIQPAELWQESGRFNAYGKEMLKIKDRHDRDILYSPTHEELVTDLFRKNIFSYKDLPKNLYQIHWKFRDEIRPRFGLMRAREFLMKDAYSFDVNEEDARRSYDLMYKTYFAIFRNMGLKPVALRADNGAIGGDLSHEFHILADTGESAIYYEEEVENILNSDEFDINKLRELYAVADEMHDEKNCKIPLNKIKSKRGIEVGHIFNFGLKYTESMNAAVNDENGAKFYPNMGSYGIGVSRVVAAAIEANHDEFGIIWPKQISPFEKIIINVKPSDPENTAFCEKLYNSLISKNHDILYDDTKASLGQKFAIADLIGIPEQIIISPNKLKDGLIEVKDRKIGKKSEIAFNFYLNNE